MKVHLFEDSHKTFFIWSQSIANDINPDLEIVEIPDTLFEEYLNVSTDYQILQDKLKNLYLKKQNK